MSDERFEIEDLKRIFENAKHAERDETTGHFMDLDFHDDVACAIIDVGKEKIYELKNEVYRYLNDPFPDFRAEAVRTLGYPTRLKLPEFRDKAYEIWISDPDEDVKIAAISAWAGYYDFTSNADVLKKLYKIIQSHQNSVLIRIRAFFCLIYVAEKPQDMREGYEILELRELESNQELDKAINWDRIDEIMEKYVPGWKK